ASTRWRVKPGLSSTMAFRCPTSRLNNVDSPTVERPTMSTSGLLMTRKTAAKPPPQPTQSTQTTQSTQSPASPLTPGLLSFHEEHRYCACDCVGCVGCVAS